MNPRGLRRYIDDLLRGRRPRPFRPDDFEAAQIRTAIDLQAAKPGADAPRPEFLADVERRLADQHAESAAAGGAGSSAPASPPSTTRRQVIVGTSAAAAAAVAAVSVDRLVRRVNGKPEAVSGVCTHQGCRLWFDAPDDRLRCPCHSTSFAPTGQVLTHQLPIAPSPLPALQVREVNGVIEVLAPTPEQPT